MPLVYSMYIKGIFQVTRGLGYGTKEIFIAFFTKTIIKTIKKQFLKI